MLKKTRAIVLHTIRQGESSLIVQCFTEQWGRQSYLVKGARKSKRSSKANLFQPLSLLDLDIYFKASRDLQWLKEASLINPLSRLQQDIYKSAQAIFIAEVLARTLKEEEQNLPLYQFIEASIAYLDALEGTTASFHLLFLFQLSRHLGFGPQNNYSESNKFFIPEFGSFAEVPASTDLQEQEALGCAWSACFSNSYEKINTQLDNQAARNAFLDSLLEFYNYHVDNMKRLRSVEILRTVFTS